jgi:hypothetical protein
MEKRPDDKTNKKCFFHLQLLASIIDSDYHLVIALRFLSTGDLTIYSLQN